MVVTSAFRCKVYTRLHLQSGSKQGQTYRAIEERTEVVYTTNITVEKDCRVSVMRLQQHRVTAAVPLSPSCVCVHQTN